MKPGGEQWQVDDDLLTETGQGGLFTDGYLEGDPLVSYLDSEETPLFVFGSGKRGVTRERNGETERIVPASGYRAITAITDRRIQFVVGGGRGDGDWADDVRLADVERVTVDSGLIRDQLTITASDGIVYSVYLKDVGTDRLVTFLEDVSWVWIQVEELLEDARKQLVDASQHEKSREYDAAKEAVELARAKLDEASDVASELAAEAGTGVQSRINHVERRYRETKRRVHASRATHLVDLAEENWRDDQFEDAYDQFIAAREEYLAVLDIYGLDPDKSDAMRDRIEHVDSNLDHLSRAPLRRANQARDQALEASDPETAIEHWEDALILYRRVLELDWGADEKRFESDVDMVRDRLATVVDRILVLRRQLADECQNRAEQLIDAGDLSDGRATYAEAMDHLEGAVALAREFKPDAVEDLTERLDHLDNQIKTSTTSVSGRSEVSSSVSDGTDESSDDGSSDYDDFDNWVTLGGSDEQAADGQQDDGEETEPLGPIELPDFEDDGDEQEPDEESTAIPDSELEELDPEESVVEAVAVLDGSELRDLVLAVWSELGWETTPTAKPPLPSVVATQVVPVEESTLVSVVGSGTASEADVRAVASACKADDYDRGVLVSNVTVAPNAARQALQTGIQLIDATELAGIVERESLQDLLPDARV